MLESCCVHLDRGLPSQGDPFWAYRPNRPAPLPDVVAGLLFRGCRNAAASAHYRPTSQFCSRGASLRSRPRAGISFWTMLLHDAGEHHVLTCRIPWGQYLRAGVQGRHTRKAGRPSCFDEWNRVSPCASGLWRHFEPGPTKPGLQTAPSTIPAPRQTSRHQCIANRLSISHDEAAQPA